MFEFIYRQLDPTFEMPNLKTEEEVPAILKALRYNFNKHAVHWYFLLHIVMFIFQFTVLLLQYSVHRNQCVVSLKFKNGT